MTRLVQGLAAMREAGRIAAEALALAGEVVAQFHLTPNGRRGSTDAIDRAVHA